jgi:ribosomal protein S12 methylthiotransferase accessory factor
LGREGGKDSLVFTSENRVVPIRGRRLGEFNEHVVPLLLEGRRSLDQLVEQSSSLFEPDDLRRTIGLLADQGVVIDAVTEDDAPGLAPQFSYLHEVGLDPGLINEKLGHARVTVVGLGSTGAVAATALAAANVGYVRCVDDEIVSASDPHLAQLFQRSDVGAPRAEVIRERIAALNPNVSVDVRTGPLRSDEDVAAAVKQCDFVLGCLDSGLGAVTDKLNSACLAQGTPLSLGAASGFEGRVGPTVLPFETACFRCYQSRSIATENDPQEALRELEARYDGAVDLSAHRENLPFTAGMIGHLLALQAFHHIVGFRPRSVGRVLVVDFLGSGMTEHVVLRKPWCSACFSATE